MNRHRDTEAGSVTRAENQFESVFTGQDVGGKQDYDLGYFGDETCRLEPTRNPFGPRSVTHVAGMIRHPCDRNRPWRFGRGDWI